MFRRCANGEIFETEVSYSPFQKRSRVAVKAGRSHTFHMTCSNPDFSRAGGLMKGVKFQPLSSKRLILRKPVLADAREIFNLRSNEQVNQYLDRQAATCVEDAVTFIEKILAVINK